MADHPQPTADQPTPDHLTTDQLTAVPPGIKQGSLRRFLRDYGIYGLPVVFLIYLALESYQIDFRAFYLAGKSVLLGLDPYLNHVGTRPEFYAPINAENYAYSAFRYPPLAALLFAPLALLPYGLSKVLFSLLMWLLLAGIAYQLVRRSGWRLPGEALLFAGVSFPVLAMVERGQIDPLMVALVLASYWLAQRPGRQGLAAGLLALAGLLKIFPFVVLLEWIVRRRWRLVVWTLVWAVVLLVLPWPLLGQQVYGHFWQRTLPELFGPITAANPIELHGQGIDLGRLARSLDGHGLLLSHDFTNGFMNPLFQNSAAGAIVCGLVLSAGLLLAARGAPSDLRFYAVLNLINLFNPLAWIMGLVWYLPLFFHLYPSVSRLGRWLILLPLFLPPFLNANAVLAYVIAVLFLMAGRTPRLARRLLAGAADPAGAPG
jgi:hypothetical protein